MKKTKKSNQLQIKVLENLESAKNYRNWCLSLAAPVAGSRPFELGSGLGVYAQEMLKSADFDIEKISLSEVDTASLRILEEKFKADDRVVIFDLLNPSAPLENDHTSFISWNVLEHIEDDVAALQIATKVCMPGAKVMILVPANQLLFSDFDRSIGHFRRYTKRELERKAHIAGFSQIRVKSFNFFGYFYWLLMMKLFKKFPRDTATFRNLDRIVIPVLRRLESLFSIPIGQSLVLFAQTPSRERCTNNHIGD